MCLLVLFVGGVVIVGNVLGINDGVVVVLLGDCVIGECEGIWLLVWIFVSVSVGVEFWLMGIGL